jgi:hypothetical protein
MVLNTAHLDRERTGDQEGSHAHAVSSIEIPGVATRFAVRGAPASTVCRVLAAYVLNPSGRARPREGLAANPDPATVSGVCP